MISDIIDKINKKERITEEEAEELFKEDDLIKLGKLASIVRAQKVSPKVASYVVYMNINYTNICTSMCSFCAFSRQIEDIDAYVIEVDDIIKKIRDAKGVGIEAILLQGGLHPGFKLDYYIELVKGIKEAYPSLHIHGFSPPEIVHIARKSQLSIEEVLSSLHKAGLDSIPGGGAEILDNTVRKRISPNKCSVEEWLDVMRMAHLLGIKSSATMMFGCIETYRERINHLSSIRKLQDETKGFTSFIAWTYQSAKGIRKDLKKDNDRKYLLCIDKETSAVDYLKTVAIARIFLDNFEHIEASIVTQGPKIAQLALAFGADDIGSVMVEENVVRAAGNSYVSSEGELIYLIQEAGYIPAKRNVLYNKYVMVNKKSIFNKMKKRERNWKKLNINIK